VEEMEGKEKRSHGPQFTFLAMPVLIMANASAVCSPVVVPLLLILHT